MSLIECDECGKTVSADASLCPHCGHPGPFAIRDTSTSPVESRSGKKSRVLGCLGMFAGIAIFAVAATLTQELLRPTVTDKSPPAAVSVDRSYIDSALAQYPPLGIYKKYDPQIYRRFKSELLEADNKEDMLAACFRLGARVQQEKFPFILTQCSDASLVEYMKAYIAFIQALIDKAPDLAYKLLMGELIQPHELREIKMLAKEQIYESGDALANMLESAYCSNNELELNMDTIDLVYLRHYDSVIAKHGVRSVAALDSVGISAPSKSFKISAARAYVLIVDEACKLPIADAGPVIRSILVPQLDAYWE